MDVPERIAVKKDWGHLVFSAPLGLHGIPCRPHSGCYFAAASAAAMTFAETERRRKSAAKTTRRLLLSVVHGGGAVHPALVELLVGVGEHGFTRTRHEVYQEMQVVD